MARREAGETSSGISEDLELDQARIKSVVHAKENVKPPLPKTKDTKGYIRAPRSRELPKVL